jgi:hypothetical protein
MAEVTEGCEAESSLADQAVDGVGAELGPRDVPPLLGHLAQRSKERPGLRQPVSERAG